MSNLQLEITPIGDGFSLKSKIYDSLKAAIMDMNIYDSNAELRLDEPNFPSSSASPAHRCVRRWRVSTRKAWSISCRAGASISSANRRPSVSK